MVGPFKKFVNIKKTMGKRGSLRKALGLDPNKPMGTAKLKAVAAGSGANAKKAELVLTLTNKLGKKK